MCEYVRIVSMANRNIVSGPVRDEDRRGDRLHPQRLAEYIGQERIKETLRAAIDDALSHDEPLDHVLLYGPPGLGKTTLATIIAAEMGANLLMTTGHEIERPGDMASMLTSLKPGDVLFIDEIHRLNKRVKDILYPAMENYTLSWTYGKGLELRSVKIPLEPFTLVGAMPRYHRLGPPPRDQFGITYPLDFYDKEAIQAIVRRAAGILSLEIDAGGIYEIARRARGTPRMANRLLRWVRDFAQIRADGRITHGVASQALALMKVDALGLDEVDHRLLRALIEEYKGKPVRIDKLSASVGEEADTLMDVYKPYLTHLGFLDRETVGWAATDVALGYVYPYANIASLVSWAESGFRSEHTKPASIYGDTGAIAAEAAKVTEKSRRRSAPLVTASSDYQRTAIPTMFNGRQYRSRLEARWAAFMSLCKWDYEYEPNDLAGWIPDFAIWGATGNTIWVEVKPVMAFPRSVASKMEQGLPDAYRARGDELLILGTKPSPTPRLAVQENKRPRLGWLAQTPLRAADGHWHWGDSMFGRWASGAKFGFCHSESHNDRITGIHAERCGGRPGAKTSDLSRLWAEATNLVQWRAPR